MSALTSCSRYSLYFWPQFLLDFCPFLHTLTCHFSMQTERSQLIRRLRSAILPRSASSSDHVHCRADRARAHPRSSKAAYALTAACLLFVCLTCLHEPYEASRTTRLFTSRRCGLYARAWGSVEKSSRFCDSHTQPSRAHAAEGINSRKTALETYWQPESTDNEDGCLSGQLIKYLAGGQLDTALQYATNRTILLFGDSTERDYVRYACELVQGEHGVILPDTPFWP